MTAVYICSLFTGSGSDIIPPTDARCVYTVKPRFIAPRFAAKLSYRQEFLQSRFPYIVITLLKCQTRIPPPATVIKDQTVNVLLFKPRS